MNKSNLWAKRTAVMSFVFLFMTLFAYITVGLNFQNLYKQVGADYPLLSIAIIIAVAIFYLLVAILSLVNRNMQKILEGNTSKEGSMLFGVFPPVFIGIVFLMLLAFALAIMSIYIPLADLSNFI